MKVHASIFQSQPPLSTHSIPGSNNASANQSQSQDSNMSNASFSSSHSDKDPEVHLAAALIRIMHGMFIRRVLFLYVNDLYTLDP